MEVPDQLTLGFIAAAAAGVLSLKLQFLTPRGALSATVVGTVVFGFGGFNFAIPLLVFFLTSSLFSRIRKSDTSDSVFDKTAARDGWQVLANGGFAASLVFLWAWIKSDSLYIAYLGSIAAVTADTWGTELGMIVKGATRSLGNLRIVPPGTSGGVSVAGSVAAIVGAGVIGVSGLPVACVLGWKPLVIVAAAGVAGSAIDSVLGATVQRRYQCLRCGRLVERGVHCGAPAVFAGGFRRMTNDWVNFFCAAVGACVAWVLAKSLVFAN